MRFASSWLFVVREIVIFQQIINIHITNIRIRCIRHVKDTDLKANASGLRLFNFASARSGAAIRHFRWTKLPNHEQNEIRTALSAGRLLFCGRGLRKRPVVNDNPCGGLGLTHAPQPFCVSNRGYGSSSIRRVTPRSSAERTAGCLPPLWGLGFKYRVKGDAVQDTVMRFASYFRRAGIPCDVLGLEPGWHTAAYSCSYRWSASGASGRDGGDETPAR